MSSMGNTVDIFCMDARFNGRVPDNGSIVLSTEGANVHGILRSLTYLVENLNVTSMKVNGHVADMHGNGGCGAMEVVAQAILQGRRFDDMVHDQLARPFESDPVVRQALFSLAARYPEKTSPKDQVHHHAKMHIHHANPEIQVRYLREMFSDYVGLHIESDKVDLSKVNIYGPGNHFTIVVTNASADTPQQICKNAGTDWRHTKIIRTVYPTEAMLPLMLATKVVDGLIANWKAAETRDIRFVESTIPQPIEKKGVAFVSKNPFENWSDRAYALFAHSTPEFLTGWKLSQVRAGGEVLATTGVVKAPAAHSRPKVRA